MAELPVQIYLAWTFWVEICAECLVAYIALFGSTYVATISLNAVSIKYSDIFVEATVLLILLCRATNS